MLVLTRKKNERVIIGGNVEVTVIEIRGDRVKLGFAGPPEVPIHREEVFRRIESPESESESAAR
ncbi:MAG: carbon storage regulator [Planctomycetota bacterium]|nr:MAG: carbon storage regulator [Planctomycetota bacterium]